MLAVSRPSAASFIWRACSCTRVKSSRKITAPTLRVRPTGTNRALTLLLSATALISLLPDTGLPSHSSSFSASRGAYCLRFSSRRGGCRREPRTAPPVLHVLNPQLAPSRHVGEIDFALRNQLLGRNQVPGEGVRNPRRREIADAEQSRLHVLRGRAGEPQHFHRLLQQHRDARERSVKQRNTAIVAGSNSATANR